MVLHIPMGLDDWTDYYFVLHLKLSYKDKTFWACPVLSDFIWRILNLELGNKFRGQNWAFGRRERNG